MINKKILYIFSFFMLFFIETAVFAWCKYETEIKDCIEANERMSAKSIEDFVCITSESKERIAYQIVLDKEFKELDKDMDKYIEKLEKNKTRYFWANRAWTYIDWLNDVDEKRKEFYSKYMQLCWTTIVWETSACLEDWKTNVYTAMDYFSDQWIPCRELVDVKMDIFDKVTFNVLMLNKMQVRKDEKKIYDQWQRRNYNKILDIMMVNFGYLERIRQKWTWKVDK